jgi:hypothetical protein
LWQKWSETCSKLQISPLELSLSYVLTHPCIERVVIGVDNIHHMRQIIDATRRAVTNDFPHIESSDLELINPSRWKLI